MVIYTYTYIYIYVYTFIYICMSVKLLWMPDKLWKIKLRI